MSVDTAKENCAETPPEQWLEVMVELDRPTSAELAAFDRGQRFRVLQANTATHRERLQEWIADEGLCAEVIGVSDPTAFNLLFVRCTQAAAQTLAHAPGVVAITRVDSRPENLLPLAHV